MGRRLVPPIRRAYAGGMPHDDSPEIDPERSWSRHGTTGEWTGDERSWPARRPGFDTGGRVRVEDARLLPPERHPEGGWSREHWMDRTMGGRPQPGPYRGRGPRGWRPSDERLREDVSEALLRDPYVDASEVEVIVDHGEVTLVGTVTERRQKRFAEETVEQVDGVGDIHNRIRVRLET